LKRILTTLIILFIFATIGSAALSGAPSGLSATVSGSQIDLSWTGSTTDTNGTVFYKLFRDTNPGVTTGDANIAFTTSTSFSDTNAVAGTTYYYSVLAHDTNDVSESSLSNEDNATIPVDSTPPTTSITDVNGDTSAPYWARTTQAVSLVIDAGESGTECKWSDTNWGVTAYSGLGAVCTTSGNAATCDLGTRSETTSTNITTYYNCKDSSDNATGGLQLDFGNDATAPTGAISSSASNDTVTVTYSGSDAHSGTAKFEVKADSGSWVDKGSSGGSHTFNNQSNGDHTYYLRVTDNSGNTFETSTSQNVDYTSSSGAPTGTPTISSPTHDEGEWTSDDEPEFDWSSVSNTDDYRYALNEEDDYTIDDGDDSTGTTREYNYGDLDDNIYWFHVAGCNSSGCGPTDHYKIKIDKTGPDVPTNIFGISQSDGSIYLSWDEPDDRPSGDNSGIKEYTVYRSKDNDFELRDPGVKKFTGIERTNFTDEDSSLVKGIAYYYRVQAFDNVDNEGVRSVDKKVLLSGGSCPLGIDINIPENVKAGELIIDITVSGGDLFKADIKVKMPGRGYETLSTNNEGTIFGETYQVPEEITGTGSILVQGEDIEENTCEKQMEFTVDSVKPEITIDSPAEGEKVGGQILIKVSASDADSGIEKVEAFVEGIRIGTLEKKDDFYEFSWNSNSKLNKTYKLEVSAQDKAGNKNVAEIEIEVYNMNEEIFIEKQGTFNTANLMTIFRNAGIKEELLSEAQTLFMENSPERKLLITRTDNGLKATIIITFKNSGQIKTLQLIEVIPKGVTNNADNIISDQQFSVVQQDPIIKFDLGEVANNKEVTIEYIVATGLTDQQANDVASQFDSYKAPPVLLEQSRQDPIEITPLSDILWIVFIIAAILIILLGGIGILGGGAFLFHRMKKNENGLKSEGLHTVYKGKTSGIGGLFKKEPEEKTGKFAWNDD